MTRKLTLCFLLCWLPAYCAAINGTTQWDVRTTGSDVNGGAFDAGVVSPGTDKSVGSAVAFSDLVCAGTTCTSVTLAFDSTSPGNFLHVASGSGCTTGWHEILSQATGTATFNDSLGTGTCTGVAYGSLLTVAQALTNLVANNVVNIKNGTYTVTTALAVPNLNHILILGYNSTHGDIAPNSITAGANSNRPVITTATNSIDGIFQIQGSISNAATVLDSLVISSTAGTPGNCISKTSNDGPVSVRNSWIKGCTNGLNGDNAGAHFKFNFGVSVYNSEISAMTTDCIVDAGTNLIDVSYSYLHGCTTRAIEGQNGDFVTLTRSVLDSNGYGVYTSSYLVDVISSVISNSTNDGVNCQVATCSWGSTNSVYYANGGYASQLNSFASTIYDVRGYGFNAYGGNGHSNALGGWRIPTADTGTDVALASCNPFTNASGADFSLSSCGKTALQGKGFPGAGLVGTGKLSIGVVEPGSSGGGGNSAWVQ